MSIPLASSGSRQLLRVAPPRTATPELARIRLGRRERNTTDLSHSLDREDAKLPISQLASENALASKTPMLPRNIR